jgi:octaprenyl-diphosphate synthase
MAGLMQIHETKTTKKVILVQEIKALVKDEFDAVDSLILEQLQSDIPLIQQICEHIISSGGKRLRPMIVLLIAKYFNYKGYQHISLATVIEFIHTATLLHDDVVDNSSLRRGRQTANTIWGNASSVLVGDFLYSRTFQILTSLKNLEIMALLAKTTNAIAEGEVMQLLNRHNPDTDEAHYKKIISNKTAKLFEVAAEVGAVLCQRPQSEQNAISKYGYHLGMAFQLIDDALDYVGDAQNLGKNIGDDLAEGKPTLPLIYAMKNSDAATQKLIRQTIISGGLEHLEAIKEAIHQTNALDYTFQIAQQEATLAKQALNQLPRSRLHAALDDLIEFAIQRNC